MKLLEILKLANIKVPLAANTKPAAIEELVNLLATNGDISDPRKVLAAVLEREATRTTGIGSGVAIPHGKCAGTSSLIVAVGKAAAPIDFQAIDGKPVSLIWLVTSPPDQTGPHIRALSAISKLMNSERIRQAFAASTSAEQFLDVVRQHE
jgi:fructose-specific phosphotransferase system IIA component